MTTANKLTIMRVLLIPVMVIIMYIPYFDKSANFLDLKVSELIFVILFMIASFTDFLDGYIARKFDQITNFGKFLDPIADKMLVFTALLFLMVKMPDRVMIWSVIVIIVREFLITAFRLLALEQGHVIAASKWGKYKTAFTMIAIIVLLFNDFGLVSMNSNFRWIGNILYYLAIFFTVYSGFDYLYKNRLVFKNKS